MAGRCFYIFLDEAGNLDFSPTGTKYFIVSSVAKKRPFHAYRELTELKYNLVETGIDLEYFHASEDAQTTRNQVFDIIWRNLPGFRVDSLIVDKSKVALDRRTEERFYPEVIGDLLRRTLKVTDMTQFNEVIVFTDQIPVNRKREAVEKAIKITLKRMLPIPSHRYRILHHASKSNFDLQIADYITWAIYRKWALGDLRSFNLIQTVVLSEHEYLAPDSPLYY